MNLFGFCLTFCCFLQFNPGRAFFISSRKLSYYHNSIVVGHFGWGALDSFVRSFSETIKSYFWKWSHHINLFANCSTLRFVAVNHVALKASSLNSLAPWRKTVKLLDFLGLRLLVVFNFRLCRNRHCHAFRTSLYVNGAPCFKSSIEVIDGTSALSVCFQSCP